MALTGNSNDEKIWNYLTGKGLSPAGAAGLMGNLHAESGLSPINLQNTYEKKLGYTDAAYTQAVDSGAYTNFAQDQAGYGLAQWTFHTRKAALLTYAKATGRSVGDLGCQLDFLMKELLEGYTRILMALKSATSIQTASDLVLTQFERPANMGDSVKKARAAYGQTYYDRFMSGMVPAVSSAAEKTSAGSCTASKVIAVAVGEIGYMEKASNASLDSKTANAGGANFTKYARDFDQKYPAWYNGKKNGFAWCDMFVDWCFLTAFGYEKALSLLCQPEHSAGAGCIYSAGYYKAKGQFITKDPKPGDQIFFGASISTCEHTGIVERVDASTVYTIEGNTSNQVARRSYPLNSARIVGYGRPKYDAETGTAPAASPAVAAPQATQAESWKIGDVVQFSGSTHYASANSTSPVACKPGKAKITNIFRNGKHPYHLIHVIGGGSTVYGWVDAGSFTRA